mgnify:CR=1 FL=1
MDPIATFPAASPNPDEDRARALAARQLTVTLLMQLVAAMRKTVPESGAGPAPPGREVLEGTFDRALAEALARQDPLGLERRLADRAAPVGGASGRLKVLEPVADTRDRWSGGGSRAVNQSKAEQ